MDPVRVVGRRRNNERLVRRRPLRHRPRLLRDIRRAIGRPPLPARGRDRTRRRLRTIEIFLFKTQASAPTISYEPNSPTRQRTLSLGRRSSATRTLRHLRLLGWRHPAIDLRLRATIARRRRLPVVVAVAVAARPPIGLVVPKERPIAFLRRRASVSSTRRVVPIFVRGGRHTQANRLANGSIVEERVDSSRKHSQAVRARTVVRHAIRAVPNR